MSKKAVNMVLVVIIILLSLIASSYGFFSNETIHEGKTIMTLNGESVELYGKGIYNNESISYAAQARAQDLVTLIIGLPLLIVSLILSNKNSIKGKLLLTGTLGYFLYTYISYSFLVTYNGFFLIYVALMSLSFFSFVLNITSGELKGLEKRFEQKFPRKYIGIVNIIMGMGICLLWLGMIIPSIGVIPSVLEHHTTFVIQALDLGFIVPVAILSGVLLIKNKSLGYLLTSVFIIKGTTLVLAVCMMAIFMIVSGVKVTIVEITMFPLIALICIINLYLLLKNLKTNGKGC